MTESPVAENARPTESEVGASVLLTHGYAGSALLLRRLAIACESAGFHASRWGYASIPFGVERHARLLQERLERLQGAKRMHVVTHSMGAVVLRRALMDYQPPNLERIVMLCPPNHGSHAARRFAKRLGWLSPSLRQITDAEDSYVNQLPGDIATQFEVGVVIAAGDFVVAPESTQLSGVRDTVTIPGMHSALLFKPETGRQVVHFLSHGRFDRPDSGETSGS
ncbi:MAG: alpha/beta fold hydrolase [Aureliella sp.]